MTKGEELTMKRFVNLLAVVIMLAAFTPMYVPAMFDEFGASYAARFEKNEEFCKYCGKSRKEAGNSKCPSNPRGNHSFISEAAPSK